MTSIELNKIDTIVLSGGGIKSLSYIGFFKAIFERIEPSQIKHYIGCSAGAIFALLLTLNYSIDEIHNIYFKYDFQKLIPSINLDNLISNMGMSDGIEIKNFIIELIEYKLSDKSNYNITFLELFNITQIKLTVTVTNYSLQKVEYWNHEITPNYSVLDGIIATCRIPILFMPYIVNNYMYYDGGIINNYPINFIDIHNIDSVLGVTFNNIHKINDIKKIINNDNKYEQIINFIFNILSLTFHSKIFLYDKIYINKTITLINNYYILDININDSDKYNIIEESYNITNNFI